MCHGFNIAVTVDDAVPDLGFAVERPISASGVAESRPLITQCTLPSVLNRTCDGAKCTGGDSGNACQCHFFNVQMVVEDLLAELVRRRAAAKG